ncbi:MAG: aminotransferase [Candidatus Marinimicrobia bacterium]|nr:aminotransferase [Candidatus Neomarinimicrobiota bacterium]
MAYLNHGSFGACPKLVFDSLISKQMQLENQPVKFLDQDLQALMITNKNALANFIECDSEDLVFFQNPTTAINEVVRSLKLKKGDEILSTNHEYGAMDKTWDFICKKTGARHVKSTIDIPFKNAKIFTDNFLAGVTDKTKVFFLSHMTSPTALFFPIDDICKFARKNNILTIVDGAHIPGHLPLNINSLGVDIYVGACHKWLLCPKGTSFLYVDRRHQKIIDPLIISWGYESDINYNYSDFQLHHYWQGTRDASSFLTITDALKFREMYNWEAVSQQCKDKIIQFRKDIHNITNIESMIYDKASKWLGQMYSFEVDYKDNVKLKNILLNKYNIEIPVIKWQDKTLIRISLNGYNTDDDVFQLLDTLKKIIN